MADNREYFTHPDDGGNIQIAEEVISSIVVGAIGEIDGVAALSQNVTGQITEQFTGKKSPRGVHSELRDGALVIDVFVLVQYGFAIPETAARVQAGVQSAVSAMTGFSVKTVNVHVSGISFGEAAK